MRLTFSIHDSDWLPKWKDLVRLGYFPSITIGDDYISVHIHPPGGMDGCWGGGTVREAWEQAVEAYDARELKEKEADGDSTGVGD